MKKDESSLPIRGKIVSVLLILVCIFYSIIPFYFKIRIDYSHPYYAVTNIVNTENIIEPVVQEYIKNLKEQQYTIISNKVDITTLIQEKSLQDETIINNLNIIVSSIELQIDGEYFYFKNMDECDIFLKEVQNIVPVKKYTIKEKNQELKQISTQEDLELKLAKIKQEKEIRLANISNRSSFSRNKERSTVSQVNISSILYSYYYISSNYGIRNGKMHTGIDIAADLGTDIYAWKNGIVTFAGWNGSYGYQVIIDHQDGTITTYSHCSKLYVAEGQDITKGYVVAAVGSTGNSTGPHLHFEVKVNNSFVNPLQYL